jgi:hypothetical protein
MSYSDQWFCNECAKKVAALPSAPAASLLSTTYQQQKFEKHTVGDPAAPKNSIYVDVDAAAYEQSVRRTLQDGALQIDVKGRRNVFRAVNRPIGVTQIAQEQFVVSGEKVALGDEQARVHGFPYGSAEIPKKRCGRCGILIPW